MSLSCSKRCFGSNSFPSEFTLALTHISKILCFVFTEAPPLSFFSKVYIPFPTTLMLLLFLQSEHQKWNVTELLSLCSSYNIDVVALQEITSEAFGLTDFLSIPFPFQKAKSVAKSSRFTKDWPCLRTWDYRAKSADFRSLRSTPVPPYPEVHGSITCLNPTLVSLFSGQLFRSRTTRILDCQFFWILYRTQNEDHFTWTSTFHGSYQAHLPQNPWLIFQL